MLKRVLLSPLFVVNNKHHKELATSFHSAILYVKEFQTYPLVTLAVFFFVISFPNFLCKVKTPCKKCKGNYKTTKLQTPFFLSRPYIVLLLFPSLLSLSLPVLVCNIMCHITLWNLLPPIMDWVVY